MVATGGRSYRSRLGSLDCYSFRKAKAGGQKISIAVAVHSLDSTLQLQFA